MFHPSSRNSSTEVYEPEAIQKLASKELDKLKGRWSCFFLSENGFLLEWHDLRGKSN